MRSVLVVRCLQDERLVAQSRVIDDAPEGLKADLPLTDVLVTVQVRAELRLRIVRVDNFHSLQSEDGGERVAGVNAVAQRRIGRLVSYRRSNRR